MDYSKTANAKRYERYKTNYDNVAKPFKTLTQQLKENFDLDSEYNEADYRADFFKEFPEFRPRQDIFDEENCDYSCMPQLI